MVGFSIHAIVDMHVEAARHRHQDLLQGLVAMPGSGGAAGNVIEVINSADIERNLPAIFDKSQRAARVYYAREFQDLAIGDCIHRLEQGLGRC